MKIKLWIFHLIILSLNIGFTQNPGTLYLENNILKGDCENQFYTGFEIELDTIYRSIDSTSLFRQFPRIGKLNFKNRIQIPTEFTITERAGYPQIMFRFKSNYLTFDKLDIKDQSISFTIDHDPKVPATEKDLRILKIAQNLLSDEKFWNKNDDRNCEDDLENNSFSLYCALRMSSLEVESHYNHRNAVLQKLRHLINTKYPNRNWNHRLMDFNNMEETSYEDILNILSEIESSFIQEINSKKTKIK